MRYCVPHREMLLLPELEQDMKQQHKEELKKPIIKAVPATRSCRWGDVPVLNSICWWEVEFVREVSHAIYHNICSAMRILNGVQWDNTKMCRSSLTKASASLISCYCCCNVTEWQLHHSAQRISKRQSAVSLWRNLTDSKWCFNAHAPPRLNMTLHNQRGHRM